MVYGIEKFVSDGVPASLFPTHLSYYRLGSGKYHSLPGCQPRAGSLAPVELASLRERDLCLKCARYPSPAYPDLGASLHTAQAARFSVRALEAAAGQSSWQVVADLQLALVLMAAHLKWGRAFGYDALMSLRTELAAALSDQCSRLRVDVDGWAEAALTVGAGDRDAPDDLAVRRTRLWLPPAKSRTGSRDGAWLLPLIAEDVAAALLDGHGWSVATDRARQRARAEVVIRDHREPALLTGLDDVVTDYVDHWHTQAQDLKAAGHGTDMCLAVVNLGFSTNLPGARLRAFRRFLAPATAAETHDGHWLAAFVPKAVATALSDLASTGLNEPAVAHIAERVETDIAETLQMLVAIVQDDQTEFDVAIDAARAMAYPVPA